MIYAIAQRYCVHTCSNTHSLQDYNVYWHYRNALWSYSDWWLRALELIGTDETEDQIGAPCIFFVSSFRDACVSACVCEAINHACTLCRACVNNVLMEEHEHMLPQLFLHWAVPCPPKWWIESLGSLTCSSFFNTVNAVISYILVGLFYILLANQGFVYIPDNNPWRFQGVSKLHFKLCLSNSLESLLL